ncbi:unnamed protein product [Clavelina lepadiformis]|uniref:C2H2-type domain-containing protein n=1 Tax=Clavelina lepadiformis TaxID=159417 RepID=A0ABP0GT33_CLALP
MAAESSKRIRKKRKFPDYEESAFVDIESINDDNVVPGKRPEKKKDRPKIKCTHCGYATRNTAHMRQHIMKQHLTIKTLECEKCKYKTVSKRLLNRHQQMKHSIILPSLVCERCGYTADSVSVMKHHKLFSHQRKLPWTCSFCSFAADNELKLHCHTIEEHDKISNAFNCGLCGFGASTKDEVKRHTIRRHLNSFNLKKKRIAES